MNRIDKVDKIMKNIMALLPEIYDKEVDDDFKETHFLTTPDHTEILSTSEEEIETLANFIDQLYGEGVCNTGYYDPIEDERNGEVDAYTGMYFVSIA